MHAQKQTCTVVSIRFAPKRPYCIADAQGRLAWTEWRVDVAARARLHTLLFFYMLFVVCMLYVECCMFVV